MIEWLKRIIKLNIAQPYWNARGSFIYYGQQIFFPKDSVIFQRTIKSGIFEINNVQTITALMKGGTEIFDIGANIGIMLTPLLTSEKNVTIVAVEASPNNIPYLQKTHANSPYKNRWTIINKAAYSFNGKINFQMAGEANGAYDSINDTKRISFEKSIEIDCITIDTIWENRNKPEVSFIKIDIEGADLMALKGGIMCINKCKPAILMEWNQTNIAPFNLTNSDLFEFARSINYTIYALPYLNKAADLKDLQLYSNFTEDLLLTPNSN